MMPLADPKRWLPLLLALLAGSVVLASYLQANPIRPLSDGLLQIAALLTSAGLLLGILNVLNVHLRRMIARTQHWQYSGVLVIGLVATFGLALLPGATSTASGPAGEIFRYVYQPLAVSILALLSVFALRAAWRALHARPGEASIILAVAVLFLLANGPWAAMIPGLSELLQWIRAYPVLGVARGVLLGIGIGALVAGARVLLGFDQPYLDR
jgi:hypothetical protein